MKNTFEEFNLKSFLLTLSFDLIFLLIGLIVCVLVMLPIYNNVIDYPFYFRNGLLIVLFFMFTRYLFFLKFSFWATNIPLKVFFILFCIPIIFLIAQEVSMFQNFMDEKGIYANTSHLDIQDQRNIIKYVKTEYVFFGISSTIVAVLFPFRLMKSIWRNKNMGTA